MQYKAQFTADGVEVYRRKADRSIKVTLETGENFTDVASKLFKIPTGTLIEVSLEWEGDDL